MQQSSFYALLDKAKKRKTPLRIAAAGPAKGEVLENIKRIQEEKLADLTLIGDTTWIFQAATRAGLSMAKVEMIHEPVLELPAAQAAVEEANKGKVQILMNGYVSSFHMVQAAMASKKGLRVYKQAFSQLTAVELPGYSKLLFITDTGIHAKTTANDLQQILENALAYLKTLGMEEIRVALIKGISLLEGKETKGKVHSPVSEVAPLLEGLKEKYSGLILLGPMSLEESLKEETPDVFLVPDAEAGQVLCHALSAFAHGKAGHIILGGKVPMVLTANNPTADHLWRATLMALNAVE